MDFINWKDSEISLSVIVGCLPCLRPLFDRNAWCRLSKPQSYGIESNLINRSKGAMNITKSTEFQLHCPTSERQGSTSSSNRAPPKGMKVQYSVNCQDLDDHSSPQSIYQPTFLKTDLS